MSRIRQAVRAALLLLVLTAGCGPDAPPEPEPGTRPLRWVPWPSRSWSPEDVWHGREASVSDVVYPRAVNGTVYRRRDWKNRHLAVDLVEDGSLIGHGVLGTDEARRSLVEAMRRLRAPNASSPPVMVRASWRTAWPLVARLLALVTREDSGTEWVQVELEQRFSLARRLDLRVVPLQAAGATDVAIRLSRTTVRTRSWVTLRAAAHRIEFPGVDAVFEGEGQGLGPGHEDMFNQVWAEVEEVLTQARGTTRTARIEASESGPPVPFAYVVTTIDILIDAGYRTVVLPDAGVAFAVEPPPPYPYEPPPAVTDTEVLLAALAVVLAFAVTLGSVGRARPRRRRPEKRV